MKIIKKFFNNFILFINLDKYVKREIIKKGYGNPIKLLNKKTKKTSFCPSNAPIEYFSKDSIFKEMIYFTDINKKVVVKESYIGLNFEAPCDRYELEIYEIKK